MNSNTLNINNLDDNKTHNGSTPLVGVLANTDSSQDLRAQTVDDKYVFAAINGAGATPIIIPTILNETHLSRLFSLLDGIVLTGDASNIDPNLYGVTGSVESHGPFDEKRDETASWLIKNALKGDVPLLGICRGMQEMNVVLGGTIQTGIIEKEDYTEHKKINYKQNVEERYAHSHQAILSEKGMLKKLLRTEKIWVNSLHEQAVDQLAQGLIADAYSLDNLIEAFHLPKKRFFLGIQWHVEHALETNNTSRSIFKAFADSLRKTDYSC